MTKVHLLGANKSYDRSVQTVSVNQVVVLEGYSYDSYVVYEVTRDKWGITYHLVNLRTHEFHTSDLIRPLSEKFGKLWIAAEVVLFVLVGAAVDIRYTLSAGIAAVFMIFIALIFRTAGVLICTIKTKLNMKERIFCVIAYLPKATVQAAIGSVPLAAGLASGKIILSVAVLAIIITAPLGALGIDNTYKKLLEKE